ncbi:MAG: type I glutamate--ammonia ligase [Actinomycetota bacterium]|nr:type I glutamate--ammonia ligase [Actinomycetota bacterium]
MVDLKFTDLPGTWQHMGMSLGTLDADSFSDGIGFDGSSIRGFQEIYESDMLLMPDASSAIIDPFYERTTVSIICTVADPITREPYTRDPRFVATKADAYLRASGVADVCYMGPEAEFYVFDHVAFDQQAHTAYYEVESSEGHWTSGQGFQRRGEGLASLGYKNRSQEGYFPAPPNDTQNDLRADMVATLEALGIRTESHHHEVGGPGQAEIDLRFLPLLEMADALQLHKYVVKNTAKAAGKTATFLPKPIFEENGSGMHTHQSLWKDGQTLMHDEAGYALLSKLALGYAAGLLEHGRAVMAFCAPSTNSYRRLVPGYEAPVLLKHSQRNRSAAVRIPMYSTVAKTKRIEFRPPDPLANPYLAFTAMLMAGLDGIERNLVPGEPLDVNMYELPAEQLANIPTVPTTLDDALDALEADHGFLTKGGVFTEDVIETYIEFHREQSDKVKIRPHPYEFPLYFDG